MILDGTVGGCRQNVYFVKESDSLFLKLGWRRYFFSFGISNYFRRFHGLMTVILTFENLNSQNAVCFGQILANTCFNGINLCRP